MSPRCDARAEAQAANRCLKGPAKHRTKESGRKTQQGKGPGDSNNDEHDDHEYPDGIVNTDEMFGVPGLVCISKNSLYQPISNGPAQSE